MKCYFLNVPISPKPRLSIPGQEFQILGTVPDWHSDVPSGDLTCIGFSILPAGVAVHASNDARIWFQAGFTRHVAPVFRVLDLGHRVQPQQEVELSFVERTITLNPNARYVSEYRRVASFDEVCGVIVEGVGEEEILTITLILSESLTDY